MLGILQSSTWGFLAPRTRRSNRSGSLAVFVVIGGALLLWAFVVVPPPGGPGSDLVHLRLFEVLLRSGLVGLFTQNLVLMGVFFVVPLYLQLVIGLDAPTPGCGCCRSRSRCSCSRRSGHGCRVGVSVRTIVRTGLAVSTLATVVLIATVDAQLNDLGFAVSMALLGVGMGLIVSQLGNVVQSLGRRAGPGRGRRPPVHRQQLGPRSESHSSGRSCWPG